MRICYFNLTNDIPPRDKVYLIGLKENGVEIIDCRDSSPFLKKFLNLYKKHRSIKNGYDLLFVGYSAHILVPFARLISNKKIVFNALGSLYEGTILSRKRYGLLCWRVVYCLLIDFLAFHSSSLTLVETNEQKKYLKNKFFIPENKITRSLTGVNENKFFYSPNTKKLPYFTILFRGGMLPESGIEYAIKAACLLKNQGVNLRIVGTGIMADKVRKLITDNRLKNVEWITEKLPDNDLRIKMQECHLILGQLSSHDRLNRTIPHKVFESIAMKIPYLTARNKGVLELLKEEETGFCANPSDPEDLARKIIELKNNPELMAKIAENAYQLYQKELRPLHLARHLLNIIKDRRWAEL